MQIWKFPCQFMLTLKSCLENFGFLILRIFQLCDRKVLEMFVYKHSETIKNFKK